MLPLALALIALGVFLSARAFEVEGLPEIADTTLALGLGGALAFTAVFHSLIFGRRERGLLFFGLLPLVTAGVIYALVTFVEDEPDATEWWPVLLAALGITFLLTFALERGHDVRLILLGVLTLVAAGTAYTVTSGLIEQDLLDRAGEYWPLLLVALGIGLLPLAFRRTR
jgi:drug/metabolite transporter (DMT)-like permease